MPLESEHLSRIVHSTRNRKHNEAFVYLIAETRSRDIVGGILLNSIILKSHLVVYLGIG